MKLNQNSLNEIVRGMIARNGVVPDLEKKERVPHLLDLLKTRNAVPPEGQVPSPKTTIETPPSIPPLATRTRGKYPFLKV